MDYQLDGQHDGMTLIAQLRARFDQTIPAVLITAVRDNELAERCAQHSISYMPKPAKPAKLRALVQHIMSQRGA